jgi:methionyl-tRNA synthetase
VQPIPTIIVAPPPTPNGDLHVGHLSGPYLGADVLRRALLLQGEEAVATLSVDLNQTYVVTTAERLGVEPNELACRSHAEVQDTLAQADIRFDVVGIPDNAYFERVRDWFVSLDRAGFVKAHRRMAPYDVARGRFMFESYAAGSCPICLAATKANICEACGHPNDAQELIGLYPTGGSRGDPIETREIDERYLDLEALRGPLEAHLSQAIPQKRPALDRLLSELFAKPLPRFPLTFPSSWGIPAPFAHADGLVLNVWAEMVPGHYWFIDRALEAGGHPLLAEIDRRAKYVQYLGFDNSFFYVVAQLALALAAREAGTTALLPSAFVTNEFYLLDNFKFSTSQGHLIWGRDLLAETPADEVRFYLAWNNPEYNQANFTRADMERVVATKYREPLKELIKAAPTFAGASVERSVAASAMRARFSAAFDWRRPSLRIAAQTISNGFDLLSEQIGDGEPAGVVRGIGLTLACGMAPIAPGGAKALAHALGFNGPLRWPTDAYTAHVA